MKRIAVFALLLLIIIYILSWTFIGRSSILPSAASEIELEWVDRFKCIYLIDNESYDNGKPAFRHFSVKALEEFIDNLHKLSDSIVVKPWTQDINEFLQQEYFDFDCAYLIIYIKRNTPFIARVEVDFLVEGGSASYLHRYIWFFGWHHIDGRRTSMS